MSCCNNCFDAGCVNYCEPSIALNAVAPADGIYKLAFYLGSVLFFIFEESFLMGDALQFNLDTALNSDLEYNVSLLDANNQLMGLEDTEETPFSCFTLHSLKNPALGNITVPLTIA